MLPLGTKAPDFLLPDPEGRIYGLKDFLNVPALLVMFICNHCPYVKHVQGEIAKMGRDFQARGVGVLAVCSNDAQKYPDDAPPRMMQVARQAGYTFPYVYDPNQEAAKAYRAACTPEFYLFDRDGKLVYRGQMDDSRPGNGIPVTGRDLRAAVEAVLEGKPISAEQKPSIGCNIKWKPGNEPDYFS